MFRLVQPSAEGCGTCPCIGSCRDYENLTVVAVSRANSTPILATRSGPRRRHFLANPVLLCVANWGDLARAGALLKIIFCERGWNV